MPKDMYTIEEAGEKSAEEIAKELLKKQYELYVDTIRQERDKDMCWYYHFKASGVLDFAMKLGIVDFAESFCMYHDMDKITRESILRCEKEQETKALKNAEELKSLLVGNAGLAQMFFDTFNCPPEQAEFMTMVDCAGEASLIYQNGTDTAYYLNVREVCGTYMLDITASRTC